MCIMPDDNVSIANKTGYPIKAALLLFDEITLDYTFNFVWLLSQ